MERVQSAAVGTADPGERTGERIGDGTGDGSADAPAHRARRTVALPPEPGSPGRARRVLRETLEATDRMDCLDAAELACTELVTNAVLHAHTTVILTVEVTDDVRVEVRDASGTLPRRAGQDAQATTGRGLALVAALTDAHGVADAGPHGKTVWFTIGGAGHVRSEEEVLRAWDTAAWEGAEWDDWEPAVGDVVRAPVTGRAVRLLGLPSTLWLATRRHHDALLRELALYLTQHPDLDVDVVATDRARFLLSAGVAAASVEHRSGRSLPSHPVDLELTVPPEVAHDFVALHDTLGAAERLACDGVLLARPGRPDVVAVRDWLCEQVIGQIAGNAPTSWPAARQAAAPAATRSGSGGR